MDGQRDRCGLRAKNKLKYLPIAPNPLGLGAFSEKKSQGNPMECISFGS